MLRLAGGLSYGAARALKTSSNGTNGCVGPTSAMTVTAHQTGVANDINESSMNGIVRLATGYSVISLRQ